MLVVSYVTVLSPIWDVSDLELAFVTGISSPLLVSLMVMVTHVDQRHFGLVVLKY